MSLPSTTPVDLFIDFRSKCVELAERYVPRLFETPMELGFRWIPQWSASSVRTKKNSFVSDNKMKTPFNRAIWDWFSLALWDKCCLLSASSDGSPSARGRLWPFTKQNLEWASGYITPTFCFFAPRRTLFHSKGEEDPQAMSFPWSLHTKVDDLDSIYCLAGRWLHEMLTFSYSVCWRKIKAAGGLDDDSMMIER